MLGCIVAGVAEVAVERWPEVDADPDLVLVVAHAAEALAALVAGDRARAQGFALDARALVETPAGRAPGGDAA
jgi:hypothetical protein